MSVNMNIKINIKSLEPRVKLFIFLVDTECSLAPRVLKSLMEEIPFG